MSSFVNEMNTLVVSMALENPDLVDLSFLFQFMSKFSTIGNQQYRLGSQ